jgi:hypothetical protein
LAHTVRIPADPLLDPPTEGYVREINGIEVEVEFLTDRDTRGDKDRNVLISGVVAQPLRYLTLSLKNSIQFKIESGEIGLVVSPGAWILHKGLTFPLRKSKAKVAKDLYGIWYVATQLGKISEDAITALILHGKIYPKWLNRFRKNLRSWKEGASPEDWGTLEEQDPFGELRRLPFKSLIERLVL